MNTSILVLPGIGNSGPQHWQTLWEEAHPSFRRIRQRDWDHPVCSEWVDALQAMVLDAGLDTVLVAHSLACLMVAHWAAAYSMKIRGALLVSVPDPAGLAFPKEAIGFAPVPMIPFPFPSMVVASSDDPYGSIEHMARCANAWGSRLVIVGAAGHINAASNLGAWPEGYRLLESLLETSAESIS